MPKFLDDVKSIGRHGLINFIKVEREDVAVESASAPSPSFSSEESIDPISTGFDDVSVRLMREYVKGFLIFLLSIALAVTLFLEVILPVYASLSGSSEEDADVGAKKKLDAKEVEEVDMANIAQMTRIRGSSGGSSAESSMSRNRQHEKERIKQERLDAEKSEAERLAAEEAAGRAELERIEKDRIERDRLAAEKAETESMERERLAAEKAWIEKERIELERRNAEKAEAERAEEERLAAEEAARQAELERLKKEVEEEKLAAEEAARQDELERLEKERMEREQLAAEKAEARRLEEERSAAEEAARQAELERLEQERCQITGRLIPRQHRQAGSPKTATTESNEEGGEPVINPDLEVLDSKSDSSAAARADDPSALTETPVASPPGSPQGKASARGGLKKRMSIKLSSASRNLSFNNLKKLAK
eukprot:CAMPEP_0172531770 /NCGR_PEP_ID=MMETSP1067-20121228/5033_1 /TAXON_ID=265564 ORGANISM="Thalassiosira punctigera, Strain Tpunct2005C2" /NCGR_SAMPLE_ID=MMETSP1067 /ASSEMBLY_ACC=CAM_ASM_000444 /LENGTH=423 /DNA_ID=CAMNT_0013316183 /DNA_START=63 /DNA_END=1334 /DNA_ORIENTATION=-